MLSYYSVASKTMANFVLLIKCKNQQLFSKEHIRRRNLQHSLKLQTIIDNDTSVE